jgi:hypothetical protein
MKTAKTSPILLPALAFLCIGLQTTRAEILMNGDLEAYLFGQPSSWIYLAGDGISAQTNESSPFTNIYQAGSSSVLLTDGAAANVGPRLSQSFSSVSGSVNLNFDFKLSALAGDPWLVLPSATDGFIANNIRIGGSNGNFSISNGFGPVADITSLTAGTWYQVSTTLDLTNSKYSGSITPFGGASTTWSDFVLNGNAHDLVSVTIEDAVFAAATNGAIKVDNFSLSPSNISVAAVPETSTWVMGFLALGATVFLARRKTNRQPL